MTRTSSAQRTDWRHALLKAIGAPVTGGNLRFLTTWQRWEGGHTNNSATWNWLNTTHGPGHAINSVGVKAFPDFQTGIHALADTLHNGRYDDILQALWSGKPFRSRPTAGLETWVSGSPNGNPEYAQKILGGGPASGARVPISSSHGGPQPPGGGSLEPPPPSFDPSGSLARMIFADDPSFLGFLESMKTLEANQQPVAPRRPRQQRTLEPRSVRAGRGISVPTSWRGTHVTDGLGWGSKTAEDIMGKPGTPVSLSEDVEVIYYHPTGAQGGGSMLLRTADGHEYWVGHITSTHKAGDRVRAGSPIASIADQSVSAPHVHVDRR